MMNCVCSRRGFLRGAGLALLSVAGLDARCMAMGVKVPVERKDSNVLFIISDDLCTCLSGYRHPQCKTPNLDRLGRRGLTFDNAYCQFPVCGPSRASIMTGQYPRALGIIKNSKDFRLDHPDLISLPQFFRNQGYYAARVSKVYHMGIPRDIIAGTSGTDDPESWDEAINVKGPEQYAVGQKEDLSPKIKHKGVDFVKIEAEGDDMVHADGMAAAEAIGLLQKLKDRKFFLALGMVRPHVPLVAPKSYFEPYPPQDMELAEVPAGDLDDVPKAAKSQTNAVKYGMNDEQQRKTLSAYYASVSYMDAQVGKVLDELERLGLDDNTVVVFTSDHGYNLGQHTSWQKLSLWEDSVRSPLIISAPTVSANAKAKRCGKVVELIDLYPTIVDLCGFSVPANLPGKSLGPLVGDPDTKAWEDKAAYTISTGAGESLRTKRWRYNLWGEGKKGVELYDHDNDPGEFTNLAEKEEYREVVESLNIEIGKARKRAQSIT